MVQEKGWRENLVGSRAFRALG